VKVYPGPEKGPVIGKTAGFFGGAILEQFGDRAIEDEGRLKNLSIREHFLTRVFAFARFHTPQQSPSMHDLVRFHAENKLLLMAYSQTKMRELGRILRMPMEREWGRYWSCTRSLFEPHCINLRDTRHQSMSSCTLSGTSKKSYPSGKSGTFSKCWKHIVKAGHP